MSAWRGWCVGVAVLCWSVGAAGAAGPPMIESDPSFVASYFQGFVPSCTKQVHGNPDIGKLACSCAAAVVADRFTIDEVKSLQGKDLTDFDKVHAGTSKLIGVCGQAAKATVGK